MYFNSYNFVLYFMPVLLVGYYILGKKFKPAAAHMWLLAFSILFCATHGIPETLILLGDVIVNYLISKAVSNISSEKQKAGKALVALSVTANIGVLFVFKYLGFFVSVIDMITGKDFSVSMLLMPVGISYLTFRMIGYTVGVYRKELKVPGFFDFLLYAFYFPMLVQGPITSSADFLPQLSKEGHTRYDPERFAKGLFFFAMGLLKKMLLADTIAKAVTWGYDNVSALTTFDTILVMLSFSCQLYFDFSGYCDMANGISEMLGISLPLNFDSPYRSKSLGEIWRRWHITLGEFLRKYVYIPLGGNRKGLLRTYINLIVVFALSGLWHGAGFTYILWGLVNGLVLCLERLFKKGLSKVNGGIRWFLTFLIWNVAFLLFRSESLAVFAEIFTGMFKKHDFLLSTDLLRSATLVELEYIEPHLGSFGEVIGILHLPILLAISFIIIFGTKNLYEKEFKPGVFKALFSALSLFWCIVSMGGMTTFLYAVF